MNGFWAALRVMLSKPQAVGLGASGDRIEKLYGGLHPLCRDGKSQGVPAVSLLRQGGSSLGRGCANLRCQLCAALGLAGTLDVIS